MTEKKAQGTSDAPKVANDAPKVAIDAELEQQKAEGKTESQQDILAYNKGRFQTHDPITGEPRSLNEPAARVDLTEPKE